jgi:hypothetical protein
VNRIINDPEQVADEAIRGVLLAYPDILVATQHPRVLRAAKRRGEGKVGIVTVPVMSPHSLVSSVRASATRSLAARFLPPPPPKASMRHLRLLMRGPASLVSMATMPATT